MATLTKNLFWGQGERDHRLRVVDGAWPSDLGGQVVVIGPDKRRPGGHWFAEHGLLEQISMRPDRDGLIRVRHRRVDTVIARLRRRLPFLFARVGGFIELSPFGVTNLANTGVQPFEDRLFVGYDAGRPIEVDPDTLRVLSPVGSNDEWLQSVPGLLEPLCAVAAHPAADHRRRCMWFVNYDQAAPAASPREIHVARWDLHGEVRRWRLDGVGAFDSIHDVKVSGEHLVFSDLPFVVEPGAFRGAPRTRRNQEHGSLWIVPIDRLDAAAPGSAVPAVEVRLPMPTGHLFVDAEEADGCIRVIAQHMPLADLMITVDRDTLEHRGGEAIDPNYEGMVALGLQPSVIGRHLVDARSGTIVESELAHDAEVWGGVLCTTDTAHPDARARHRQLWCAGVGFDPDLVPEPWWTLYGDASDGVVAPGDLPDSVVPGTLARFDLEAMKVAELWRFEQGSFASPPTFVPRVGATTADDGYVVVVVHQDGPKEIQVFDANRLADGPVARASSPTFNPSLLLHSAWMPDARSRPARPRRVPLRRDLKGALRALPSVMARLVRNGRAMSQSA